MVAHCGQGQKWTQAFEGIASDVLVPQCGQVIVPNSSAMGAGLETWLDLKTTRGMPR